jgi:plastocyanin
VTKRKWNGGALALTVVALVAVGLTGVALTGVAGAGGSAKVRVGDNFFDPTRLQVPKGTRLKFRWRSTQEEHNVTKARGPGGGFSSRTTDNPGFVYKKTLRKKGRYKLICTVHPDQMVLKARVG